MGRAILGVSADILERVKAALPDGHRVVAVQENAQLGYVDLVIEGPQFAAPPRVAMIVTQERDDATGRITIGCKWTVVQRNYDNLVEWTVPFERLEAADRADT